MSNCQINNNLPVEANFESVLVNKLSQKTVSVPISIACDGDAVPVTLMMAVKADPAPFSADALGTSTGGRALRWGCRRSREQTCLSTHRRRDMPSPLVVNN